MSINKIYKGDKIEKLIELDKQIKELQIKRLALADEARKETLGDEYRNLPVCGFLYYDMLETKLVEGRYVWSARHRVSTGEKIRSVRLVYLSGFTNYERFYKGSKCIEYIPCYRCVDSTTNKPGNNIYDIPANSEFEPLGDMTIDEARKVIKKVKADIKKAKEKDDTEAIPINESNNITLQ